jgi:putative membrane protein
MLARILVRWLITAIAVAAAVFLLSVMNPTWVSLNGQSAWLAVIAMAAVLGLVNALVRPLLQLLSTSCIVVTLGLFMLLINAFTLWLSGVLSGWLNTGFSVNGFWPALLGGIIISIVSFLLSIFIRDPEDND